MVDKFGTVTYLSVAEYTCVTTESRQLILQSVGVGGRRPSPSHRTQRANGHSEFRKRDVLHQTGIIRALRRQLQYPMVELFHDRLQNYAADVARIPFEFNS